MLIQKYILIIAEIGIGCIKRIKTGNDGSYPIILGGLLVASLVMIYGINMNVGF